MRTRAHVPLSKNGSLGFLWSWLTFRAFCSPVNPVWFTPVAAGILGISLSTLWARVQAGRCPAPIKWDSTTVWRVRDLEKFVDGLADQVAD